MDEVLPSALSSPAAAGCALRPDPFSPVFHRFPPSVQRFVQYPILWNNVSTCATGRTWVGVVTFGDGLRQALGTLQRLPFPKGSAGTDPIPPFASQGATYWKPTWILSDKIAATHAKFDYWDDKYWVEDLGSDQGTYLNGKRMVSPSFAPTSVSR